MKTISFYVNNFRVLKKDFESAKEAACYIVDFEEAHKKDTIVFWDCDDVNFRLDVLKWLY